MMGDFMTRSGGVTQQRIGKHSTPPNPSGDLTGAGSDPQDGAIGSTTTCFSI